MHSATDTSLSLPVNGQLGSSSASVPVDLGDYAREVDTHRAHNSRPADTAYGRAHLADVGWARQAVTR